MKYVFTILFLFLLSSFSYAKEMCIRNNKGIYCGTEVTVQGNDSESSNVRGRECVEFKGKKVCGYDCKKSIFGADCKKEKDETCISNINGVICGYNCKESLSSSACASKSYYQCVQMFNEVKCGTGCGTKYGKFECDEDDPNAKYMN